MSRAYGYGHHPYDPPAYDENQEYMESAAEQYEIENGDTSTQEELETWLMIRELEREDPDQ